ncbi:hypothetical protein P4O66_001210 [Electrophorus voltai]|uniref:Alkylated DNA repair protein AlkB homologue 8 N-terminal domain-containing protein n=1 Tax=Electrophorus voltai TaxID=2609070 RepID=A0AAD8ZAX6_9TELE|nr:hypothetical protein P4O66_001210 [Electrophorus voltai]
MSILTAASYATSSSNIIVKFADDTVIVGLISDNDERAYLEEIKHLENWCQENKLLLNVSKTKELIVDCSKKQERHYQPVRISGTTVERVDSFRYLGVHISQDLSWSRHTNSLAKKARQRLYHLRRLRDFRLPSKILRNFYTCTIESILTGNITVWFGNSTKQDRQALQRVVRSAERFTHTELPDLQTIYYKQCQTKARKIVKDPTHPNNRLFSLLRCLAPGEEGEADDTTVVGLISNDDDSAYKEEVNQLVVWCNNNNLSLNVNKTKEIIFDFRRKNMVHTPLTIHGTAIELVRSIMFLGVHITDDLTWTIHTTSLIKMAQQRLHFLRRMRRANLPSPILTMLYRDTTESVLTSSLPVWYGSSTASDQKSLQRVVRTAEKIIRTSLPSIHGLYLSRCLSRAFKMVRDPTHPDHRLFSLLPSVGEVAQAPQSLRLNGKTGSHYI